MPGLAGLELVQTIGLASPRRSRKQWLPSELGVARRDTCRNGSALPGPRASLPSAGDSE